MKEHWMEAFEEGSVPRIMIVNKSGKIAWIGHPNKLSNILPKVLNGTWDIEKERAKRIYEKKLELLDEEAEYKLQVFRQNGYGCDYYGQPDSAIHYIGQLIKDVPELKYSPFMVYNTFSALIKTDMVEALDYAKLAIREENPLGPQYHSIIGVIKTNEDRYSIPPEIFRLGAECMIAFSEETPKTFIKIAEWYWRAGDKTEGYSLSKESHKSNEKNKSIWNGLVLLINCQNKLYN